MSVYELCSLQKLRRIGLVRVTNLTDQAIYALGERHSSLERIHLSYCDQITVAAIHFLLQKLPKVTHLSLTGIPSFRRSELQQFCRTPPQVRAPPIDIVFVANHHLGFQHKPARSVLRLLWQRCTRTTRVPYGSLHTHHGR